MIKNRSALKKGGKSLAGENAELQKKCQGIHKKGKKRENVFNEHFFILLFPFSKAKRFLILLYH